MKNLKFTLLASVLLTMASCGSIKTYSIAAKSGTNTNGTARFSESNNQVTLKLDVKNLTPGIHAVHIHEKGDCSSADGTSAGGHWNPTSHNHGKWGSHTFHMGDIGNLTADNDGNAKLTFSTDKWCIGCTDSEKNIIGKAIIIHAGEDDFTTQPTGNAGGRVGCIEIK